MSAEQREVRAGMLTLWVAIEGDVHTVRLEGELDLANAPTLEAELQTALAGAGRVIVDMTGLTFIDSTGIALLVATVGRDHDDLCFVPSPAPPVVRVLELTGVAERLPLLEGGVPSPSPS